MQNNTINSIFGGKEMYYLDALKICLREVGTIREFEGYFYSVHEVLTILICGTLCGLKNISDIHTFAISRDARDFFSEVFNIERIPCYSQLTRILSIINIDSLNSMFTLWASYVAKEIKKTETNSIVEEVIAIDGKTVKSTVKMKDYERPLHIVSAQATKAGITLGQLATKSKSNEIPAVRELIKLLDLKGTVIVTDALSCQKDTVETIIDSEADYVIPVKQNQKNLFNDIKSELESDTNSEILYGRTFEENRGRLENREAFVLNDVSFLDQRDDWKGLESVGMIHSSRLIDGKITHETRFYISSIKLTPSSLIDYTRNEWCVESMHWLLDVNLKEDECRVHEVNSQKNLNVIRKLSLNIINIFKQVNQAKTAISKVMLNCLLDTSYLSNVIYSMNF